MKHRVVRDEKLLTMQEAMEYLNQYGYPCKSRSTFYRLLEDFSIQYLNVNPCGKNRIRRFPVSGLKQFIKEHVQKAK